MECREDEFGKVEIKSLNGEQGFLGAITVWLDHKEEKQLLAFLLAKQNRENLDE